jgi:hypothetical protein
LTIGDIGAWWRGPGVMLTASFTQSRFRSADAASRDVPYSEIWLPLKGDRAALFGSRDRLLNDAVASLHWAHGKLELDATAGVRLRSRTDPAQQWRSLSAALWVTRSAALVASGGRYPESFIQGFPSVRYVTLGLRFTSRSSTPGPGLGSRPAAPADERPRAQAGYFAVLRESDNAHTIRIVAPGAQRVELMADFTDWSPVSLDAVAANTWQLSMRVPPGTYLVSVRVNGGEWNAPPGVPLRRDEFGTSAGVVVVP